MMEEVYREGDEKSQELVYVSFLENIIWEEGYKELKELFGPELKKASKQLEGYWPEK